jgi:hypothetical protein
MTKNQHYFGLLSKELDKEAYRRGSEQDLD